MEGTVVSRSDRAVAISVVDQLRNRVRQAGWAADPVKWAKDVLGVHMWSKQREISDSVVNHKRTVVASCHGTGKALCVDTPIPTPQGFVAMGDISPGDFVLGSDGRPVKVIATTGVHTADRYEVTFESEAGRSRIIASADHIWPVMSSRSMSMASVLSSRSGVKLHTGLWHHRAENITTAQLAERMKGRGRNSIPARIPDTPIRGVRWDSEQWIEDLLSIKGRVDILGRTSISWPTGGLNNPPPQELVKVRQWFTERSVPTTVTRKRVRYSTEWTLSIGGDQVIDLLPGNDDKAVARAYQVNREDLGWRVVSVRPIGPGDVQCIQVDAADSLYLCGEDMVPTHNSMIASVIACWWVSTRPVGEAIVVSTAPSYNQINKILWEEIRGHHRRAALSDKPLPGRVTQGDEWKADDGTILAFGRKPPDGDRHAFHGIHRRYVLVLIDEACHDDQTDVLTEQGWKRFKDVQESDRLLCMDAKTGVAYYDRPVRLIDKQYSGDMYVYEGKGLNYAVTPDHTMLYAQRKNRKLTWKTAQHQDMVSWHNKAVKKVIDWDAEDLPTISDDFLSFLGWFGSEGHIPQSEYHIGITQSEKKNPDNHREIVSLCQRLGLRHSVYGDQIHVQDAALVDMLLPYGRTQLARRVPDFIRKLSARQIGVYLESYWKGAGHDKQGQRIIYTSSPQMADDLQELILKTGAPSVVHVRGLAGKRTVFPDGHTATSTVDGFTVTWPTQGAALASPKQSNLRVEYYEGRVYCATMRRDHLLFTRRNGYTMWSGNCGVPEEIWTGAEAITTSDSCRILAIGNPDDRNTEFGNAFLKQESAQDWNRISVPASVTPNFTGEPVPALLNEVLVSRSWCEERKRAWGEADPRYISKVEARFPEQSKSSLFAPSIIARAMDNTPEQAKGGVLRLGVDVARFGTDANVVVSYLGKTSRVEETWTGTDTVSSAYQVLEIAERIRKEKLCSWVEIRVDAVGLGAGVVDTLNARAALLKDPWFTVYEMHGSAAAPVNVGGSVHGYGNARAYWFDQLRQSMNNGSVRIEDDERIKDDLGIIFYKFKSGKLFIISKEEMRKLHGRSPDYADALAYATAPVADGLPVGSSVIQDPDDAMNDFMNGFDEGELMIAPF